MTEDSQTVEELIKRIDRLLDVLNILIEDLREITNSLKTVSGPAAAAAVTPAPTPQPTQLRTIEDIRMMFPKELEDMLTFEEKEDHIMIKPRQYLGSENFAKIASIIRGAGGEYISAGKDSHFRIPRQT